MRAAIKALDIPSSGGRSERVGSGARTTGGTFRRRYLWRCYSAARLLRVVCLSIIHPPSRCVRRAPAFATAIASPHLPTN
jgi:hypothetical protein